MKKLFGLAFFWSLLIGFYFSPTPQPSLPVSENTDFQDVRPIENVHFLEEPIVLTIP